MEPGSKQPEAQATAPERERVRERDVVVGPAHRTGSLRLGAAVCAGLWDGFHVLRLKPVFYEAYKHPDLYDEEAPQRAKGECNLWPLPR